MEWKLISICRFGGWQFLSEGGSTDVANHRAVVWFNNRGPHALPSYYNALTNVLLRQSVSQHVNNSKPEDYGKIIVLFILSN